MNKIKIFYFEQIYTKYVSELCKIISSDEFDITYLYCMVTKYWQKPNSSDLNFREHKINSTNIPIKKGTRGTHYEVFSVTFALNLLRNQPDILVIDPTPGFSFFYLFFAKISGCKIIGVPTSLPDNSFWGKLSNFILKQNNIFVNSYIVPAKIKKDMMIRLGISPDKITVMGHGIDTEKFTPTIEDISKFPHGKKIILFVGRFVEYKGIKNLLEIFDIARKNASDIFLVLIGDGPQKQEIKKLIKERDLSDHILCISNIDNEDISSYYSNADIIVVPSIEPEPFGLVYTEGMACGKPIITFDVGGGDKDLIQNEKNGLLVDLNDIDGFADALVALSSNDKKRKELGINARTFVLKNYDFQVISSRWKKIISTLISK